MSVIDSINDIVESRIRPALQSHGGDITVVSFDEESGVLSASLRGACGTCPFAQETLRSQVEAVLKEQIPQITSVVRVQSVERGDSFIKSEVLVESIQDGFSSTLEASQEAISRMAGVKDENIKMIEERYPVRVTVRGNAIIISGPDREPVEIASGLLGQMARIAEKGDKIRGPEVRYSMDMISSKGSVDMESLYDGLLCMTARGKPVRPKTIGQRAYVNAIRANDIVFGIGPAGTGKTYLAVCEAVNMLKAGAVSRIVLVRPAVEAGESLGFLPGDLKEKVEPYLRPLYDAFFELLTPERFMRYVDKNVIEVAPLAYMRGRTLNDSFIILDEAQNTTPEQMKMFITRMGFGSKAVITGDLTQVDLPSGKKSGLFVVQDILKGIKGIDFVRLENVDVVRHEIVQRVVAAYEDYEKRTQ